MEEKYVICVVLADEQAFWYGGYGDLQSAELFDKKRVMEVVKDFLAVYRWEAEAVVEVLVTKPSLVFEV